MVLNRLMAGLKDKQIMREILEEAATRDRLHLSQVKKLVKVKEQAREEAAQLNMENNV